MNWQSKNWKSHKRKNALIGNKYKWNKTRGHPELNQGPLDLQSNALPLSYIPVGEPVQKLIYQ